MKLIKINLSEPSLRKGQCFEERREGVLQIKVLYSIEKFRRGWKLSSFNKCYG
jgi:hypothetical protein